MDEKKIIARKTDWDITEMPAKCQHFKMERFFTKEELDKLRYGHIPADMEDKWFYYMEENTLYAHRSWSGICIFTIEINENTWIHQVTVNRDKMQYEGRDINKDAGMIGMLLEQWVKPEDSPDGKNRS